MVLVRDGGLFEVAVAELDSAEDEEGFGGGVNNLEAVVVAESGSAVETRASTEGPRESRGGFVVDDDRASYGAQRNWRQS